MLQLVMIVATVLPSGTMIERYDMSRYTMEECDAIGKQVVESTHKYRPNTKVSYLCGKAPSRDL